MDLASLIGLFMGMSLVGYAVFSAAGSKAGAFVDPPSALIVIGGSLASVITSFPLVVFLRTGKVMKKVFMHKEQSIQKLIEDLVGYAEIARRDGILSLESATREAEDPFIVKGIQMAVDGTDPELIEQIMNNELDAINERHARGKAVFDAIGRYGPAYGMIGTLVGLVVMLMNMSDPDSIGPAMAVALITTFYGSVMANMFALPMADKLGQRNDEEMLIKTVIIKGVMSIQSGDNPRIVEQKLKTFLPPSLRASATEEQGS